MTHISILLKRLNKLKRKLTSKLSSKFNRLLKSKGPVFNQYNKKWYKILSNNVIPDCVKEIVSLGPNFNLNNIQSTTSKKDVLSSIKNIEHSISKFSSSFSHRHAHAVP